MGIVCCCPCRKSSRRIAALPEPSPAAAHAAAAAAPTLQQALAAATKGLARSGSISGRPELHQSLQPSAAALLDDLLAALLRASGLERTGITPGGIGGQQQPATVQQLLERLRQGCALHGCTTAEVAAAVAALSFMLLGDRQTGRGRRRREGAVQGVPAADRLIGWLHTLMFKEVRVGLDGSLRLDQSILLTPPPSRDR
jgi:hypothetical protein